jgi:hypothetical protein
MNHEQRREREQKRVPISAGERWVSGTAMVCICVAMGLYVLGGRLIYALREAGVPTVEYMTVWIVECVLYLFGWSLAMLLQKERGRWSLVRIELNWRKCACFAVLLAGLVCGFESEPIAGYLGVSQLALRSWAMMGIMIIAPVSLVV